MWRVVDIHLEYSPLDALVICLTDVERFANVQVRVKVSVTWEGSGVGANAAMARRKKFGRL